jgi:hypothetical protein
MTTNIYKPGDRIICKGCSGILKDHTGIVHRVGTDQSGHLWIYVYLDDPAFDRAGGWPLAPQELRYTSQEHLL